MSSEQQGGQRPDDQHVDDQRFGDQHADEQRPDDQFLRERHSGSRLDFHTMRRDAIDNLKHRYDDIRSAVVSIQPGEPRGLRPFLRTAETPSAPDGKQKKKSKKAQKVSKKAQKHALKGTSADRRHSTKKVAFMRYGYYDIAFKYFVEQVLNAEFVQLPEATRRTLELGTLNSTDYVCAPFKHILGDYIEALEHGADVLVQFAGPCRLGYYGELQEAILRDMGYDFTMLNFATVIDEPPTELITICKEKINPYLSIPEGVKQFLVLLHMLEVLDAYNDLYLAQAGFEVESGSFARARDAFFADMRAVTNKTEIDRAFEQAKLALKALPIEKPVDPIRVGLVGEYFTAVDAHSNLFVEDKLLDMGVSVARKMNMTNRNLHYNEPNLRRSVAEYVQFDMGPTSTLTLAAAKQYIEEGFDGVIHLKSAGCTPEIDVMPVLQKMSRDYGVPILYLSYDSQTSDTGLDTRLEAFYDMIAMRKAR